MESIGKARLFKEAVERKPKILRTRKFIRTLCTIFVVSRIFAELVETIIVLFEGESINTRFNAYATILLFVLIAYAIYNGTRIFAVLILLGATYGICEFLSQSLNWEKMGFFDVSMIAASIIIALAQFIPMLLIVMNKNCTMYFHEMKRVKQGRGGTTLSRKDLKVIIALSGILCLYKVFSFYTGVVFRLAEANKFSLLPSALQPEKFIMPLPVLFHISLFSYIEFTVFLFIFFKSIKASMIKSNK